MWPVNCVRVEDGEDGVRWKPEWEKPKVVEEEYECDTKNGSSYVDF